MSQQIIDIKYGSVFPWPFRFLSAIVIVIGLSLIVNQTITALILLAAGGLILSGYEGTEIDPVGKRYREYQSFFFIKNGKMIRYSGIEKIFVNTSRSKQKMHTAHTMHGSTYDYINYNGFLKFTDGQKIPLLRKRKKEALINALKKISTLLNVPLEDHSGVH